MSPLVQKDSTVVVMGGTETAAKNLAEDLENEDVQARYFPLEPAEFPRGRVSVLPGALSGGFGYPHEKFYAFTYAARVEALGIPCSVA